MLMWGFWVLAALQFPLSAPAGSSSAQFALGLAVVAAALLAVASAAGLPVLPAPLAAAVGQVRRRPRPARIPRLLDPDAAGRPRPRAPTGCPAASPPSPALS
jgi:hypothetical protein